MVGDGGIVFYLLLLLFCFVFFSAFSTVIHFANNNHTFNLNSVRIMYYFRFSCLILFIVAAAMLFLLRRRCLSFSFRNAFAIFAPSRSHSLCACDSFCFIFSIQLYRHIVYYVYVGIRFFLLATWCKHTLCCVQPSEQVTKYRNNTYIKTNCRNIWKSHINVAPSNNCVSLWAAILCVRGAVHTRARSTHRVWSSNWTTRITYTSAVHTHTHARVSITLYV